MAIQVMVLLTTLIGMAAITVDISYMWNVRADLQRTADAAALASAAMLAELESPAERAREAAVEYVERNLVVNEGVEFGPEDVTLGRAMLVDDQYEFVEVADEEFPDAVRIRVEATRDYSFAQILGATNETLAAEATALLVPRDIALVADLSASHNDDSELGSYRDTDINIWEVWHALPGGSDDAMSLWSPEDLQGLVLDENNFHPQSAGPAWGYMRTMRWGEEVIDEEYEPYDDDGLVFLGRYGSGKNDWDDPNLIAFIAGLRFGANESPYSAQEIMEIIDVGHHSSWSRYYRQVAVAMGLARWDSGKPGGAWQTNPDAGWGDGDDRIDSNEIEWVEPFFDEPGHRWLDYIYWAASSWTRMENANSHFRYALGPKTFTNYLLERRWEHAQTPELSATPHQPMQAVKDAVEMMVDVVNTFENDDQLSLEIYGYTVRHQVPLTSRPDLEDISIGMDGLSNMQAGHFDGWTNTGGGLEAAIETLGQPPARSASHKMIVLMTDGLANVTEYGEVPHGSWADQQDVLQRSREYVIEQANIAASQGIRIFTVSVGAYADANLMQEVADIGNGEHLEATSNDIDTYAAQLRDIFIRLGGKRPVELIN